VKSDLSGKELAGSDDAVSITLRLPSGRRRVLQVAADEADNLAAMGQAPPDRLRRAWRWFWARFVRFGKWVVILIVASLLIPALTKQWTDRSKELETKSAIVTKISESSATTINTVRYLVGDVLPAASARNASAKALSKAKTRPHKNVREPRAKLARATARAQKVELATYNRIKNAWGRNGAAVESELDSYFPSSDLPDRWGSFVMAVTNYVRLASSVCRGQRLNVFNAFSSTIHVSPDEQFDLEWELSDDCRVKHRNFQVTYFLVGDRLLSEEEQLVRDIVHANAAGYSSGWSDLWHDVVPGR
jgi:hypothetical protein